MSLVEKLPAMDDADLGTLGANAERLALSGTPQQQKQAEAILPAIREELTVRRQRRTEERSAATKARTAKARATKAAKPGTTKPKTSKAGTAAAAETA